MPTLVHRPVGPTGLGLISIVFAHGRPSDEDKCFALLHAAIAAGVTTLDAGEIYALTPDYTSLHMLAAYFTKYPEDAEKIVLNVKGAFDRATMSPVGTAEGIRASVDNCVRQLDGKVKIDMFEMARVDKSVPIEESMKTLDALVKEGLIGGVALSEVSAATIRRAAAVTKITAVEVELSFATREPLVNGVAETCAELGVPILAYCPLGRGLLSGTMKSADDAPAMVRSYPRFQGENFEQNMKMVRALGEVAERKGCTSSQLALGWLRGLSRRPGMPQIIPIPGTSKIERVQENAKIAELTEGEMHEIDEILARHEVAGTRYPEAHSKLLHG